jgi:hypothetical protein
MFTLAWSFSGMDTPGPYMNASAYMWTAGPALVFSTWLLARPAKPARWVPSAISALPWAAYPWVAIATFVPHGESQQWFRLAASLALGFAGCIAVPVVRRVAYLHRPAETTEGK